MYAEESGSLQEPSVYASHTGALSREELRMLVCEWTLTLRSDGVPPERALVTVKTLVREGIAPLVSRYDDADLGDDRTALVADASQWCIEAYFNDAAARRGRARATPAANGVARRSLSRSLLLKVLGSRPELSAGKLALRLSIDVRQLAAFTAGTQLMPLDVQERLARLVVGEMPPFRRLAHRLRLQIEAAQRYAAGEVVRHGTRPPKMY